MTGIKAISLSRWLLLVSLSAGMTLAILGGVVWFLHATSPIETYTFAQVPPADDSDNFRPRVVVRKFQPITEFPIVKVSEVGDKLNPSELVLGATVGKKSRAYPINMLTGPSREILNDTLGGRAIAATW